MHAFIWFERQMMDLNDLVIPGSGWILEVATAINDEGQIVGCGSPPGANAPWVPGSEPPESIGCHGFLLPPAAAAVEQ